MKSLLIVGGSGFIGRNLINKCTKLEYKITVTFYKNYIDDLKDNKKIKLTFLDITDDKKVREFFSNNYFDYIVNLSGYIQHNNVLDNGIITFKDHINGIINIVEATKNKFPKTLVQIGSSDEYGDNLAPQQESLAERPFTPYALAKTTATKFCQMCFKSINYPCVILRPFIVFGPYQKKDRLIPFVIDSCIKDVEFEIKSGSKIRDFIHIDNLTEYIIKCFDNKSIYGEIINIGSGKKRTVKSIVEYIKSYIGKGIPKYEDQITTKYENDSLIADINKLENKLPIEKFTSFENGIKKTINFYKNKKN